MSINSMNFAQLLFVFTVSLASPSTAVPAGPAGSMGTTVQDADAQRARFEKLVDERWGAEYKLRGARQAVGQQAFGEPSPTSMAEYESALRETERLDRKLVNQYVLHGYDLPDFSAGQFLAELEEDSSYFNRASEGIAAIRAELALRIAVNLPDLELEHGMLGDRR